MLFRSLINERRKLEREEQRLMDAIAEAEDKKSDLEKQMEDPAVYSDAVKSRELQQKIEEIALQIDELTEQWEEISSKLAE